MKALAGLSALVAVTLGSSALVDSPRASAGESRSAARSGLLTEPEIQPGPATARSSRLLLGGRVRCTATVRSEVQVGQAVSVRFTLHNVSRRRVRFPAWVFSTGLVLRAADGTTYDTGAPYDALPGIPPAVPTAIRPGATKRLGSQDVPVRWRGPLVITPGCLGQTLPALRVQVSVPWPRAAESAVVGDVVAAAGHLLDHCRPQTPGVPVDGQLDPPSGNTPPMDAQCSIAVTSEGAFWVAQALVLIPPGLTGVQIFQPYETLWPITEFLPLTSNPPYEAIAWEFVVTRDRAIPVAAASLVASKSSAQIAPSFEWNGRGWRQEGEGSCGGTTFAGGGTGPYVEFISACPT